MHLISLVYMCNADMAFDKSVTVRDYAFNSRCHFTSAWVRYESGD